ncbi:MAG: lysophospholipid acyltransferase family protein [Myxococcota bacterium]
MAQLRKISRRRQFADRWVDRNVAERMDLLKADLGELGVDSFGYDPDFVKYVASPAAWLYRNYFRVQAFGIDHVPDGRCLLISNHSGQLPFDALMISTALLLERSPPRQVRSMVEKWIPRLPFVSVFMARMGQVVGTPDNCRRLLGREEAILVFPEGVRGIAKTFDQRYTLQRFGTGFMRLALETNTPIVPVAVIGAEEQAPALANLRSLARVLRVPAFPITPTFPLLGPAGLLPLPTRYRIYFGEPLTFKGHADDEDEVIQVHIDRVRAAITEQLKQGLAAREGVFL